jgi:hypothetical protein
LESAEARSVIAIKSEEFTGLFPQKAERVGMFDNEERLH